MMISIDRELSLFPIASGARCARFEWKHFPFANTNMYKFFRLTSNTFALQ